MTTSTVSSPTIVAVKIRCSVAATHARAPYLGLARSRTALFTDERSEKRVLFRSPSSA